MANAIQISEQIHEQQLEKAVATVKPSEAVSERALYISGDRLRLELGVFERLMLKLRRAQDIVSRKRLRSSSLEETIELMTDEFLAQHDRLALAKRVVAKKGHSVSETTAKTDNDAQASVARPVINIGWAERETIPAAHLHEVRLRDGEQCAHEYPDGRRCKETRWLEIHHIVPVAAGGTNAIENLITLCSAHHRQLHRKMTSGVPGSQFKH